MEDTVTRPVRRALVERQRGYGVRQFISAVRQFFQGFMQPAPAC